MTTQSASSRFVAAARPFGLAASLASTLMLGACGGGLGGGDLLSLADTEKPGQQQPVKTELEKATEYWGKQFSKDPANPANALGYARNLRAMGNKDGAFGVLQQASASNPANREIAAEYGRLALDFGQLPIAEKQLEKADDPNRPDWRVIQARATVLAKQGQYNDAIPIFERALALAPDQPSVLNNLALAHAMNGHADKAEDMLRRASAGGTVDPKVRQNLALVLGLQGKYDESQSLAGRDLPPDSAAANADYLRQMVKLPAKAVGGADAPIVAEAIPRPAAVVRAPSIANPSAVAKITTPELPARGPTPPTDPADAIIARAMASQLQQETPRKTTALKGTAKSAAARPRTAPAALASNDLTDQPAVLRPSGQ